MWMPWKWTHIHTHTDKSNFKKPVMARTWLKYIIINLLAELFCYIEVHTITNDCFNNTSCRKRNYHRFTTWTYRKNFIPNDVGILDCTNGNIWSNVASITYRNSIVNNWFSLSYMWPDLPKSAFTTTQLLYQWTNDPCVYYSLEKICC